MFKNKAVLIMMTLVLLLVASTPAYAAASKKKEPGMQTTPPPQEYTVPSYEPSPGSSSSGGTSPQAIDPGNVLLDVGRSSIGSDQYGNPVFSGDTTTQVTVEYVGTTCELQRWDGSAWVTVDKVSDTMTNTRYSIATRTGCVAPGYYYRTYTTHWALSKGTYESAHSASPYKAF